MYRLCSAGCSLKTPLELDQARRVPSRLIAIFVTPVTLLVYVRRASWVSHTVTRMSLVESGSAESDVSPIASYAGACKRIRIGIQKVIRRQLQVPEIKIFGRADCASG